MQELNPKLFKHKLNVMAEIEKSKTVKQNYKYEYEKLNARITSLNDDPNTEFIIKTSNSGLDLDIEEAKDKLKVLKAKVEIDLNKL